ncbi:hypothetical protein BDW75DRAFT_242903 [Aspergillus navahoensis]
MADQLRRTAEMQEKWLEMSKAQPFLSLHSPMIAWERSIVYGHQTHPFHRSCWAIPPLKPVLPEHIPEMIAPSLSFVSIPRKDMRVTGPVETTLEPLLQKLEIPKPTDENTLIVPCLTRQTPAILHHFENATVMSRRRDGESRPLFHNNNNIIIAIWMPPNSPHLLQHLNFWSEQARQLLDFDKDFHTPHIGSPVNGDSARFLDGKLNASIHCVDRHAIENPDRVAIMYEPVNPTDASPQTQSSGPSELGA